MDRCVMSHRKSIVPGGWGCATSLNSLTSAMWPSVLIRKFETIPANSVAESQGPYNKLLNILFPPDSKYIIIPRFPKPRSSDRIVNFEVFFLDKPVLILELKKPADLDVISARELADTEIRQRMEKLRCKSQSSLTFMDSL
jgi:hypothetical protein